MFWFRARDYPSLDVCSERQFLTMNSDHSCPMRFAHVLGCFVYWAAFFAFHWNFTLKIRLRMVCSAFNKSLSTSNEMAFYIKDFHSYKQTVLRLQERIINTHGSISRFSVGIFCFALMLKKRTLIWMVQHFFYKFFFPFWLCRH